MSKLINDIKMAQLRAGEDVVCARLEELGLVDKPNETQLEADARRYRYLRGVNINAVFDGGIFAGKTPDNVVINGVDLDLEIDCIMNGLI